VSDLEALRAAWDEAGVVDLLLRLLATPSPTGFTAAAVALLEAELAAAGIVAERNRKGDLRWRLRGDARAPVRALAAHVDTLGAVVKEVKRDGRLRLSNVGGYDWTTVEGADVTVHPQAARAVGGTVVNVKQSTHVHGPALRELARTDATMEVRLDALVATPDDVAVLGIAVGDPVSFDARPRSIDTGFVKSRHLDDKACVAVMVALTRAFVATGRRPAGDLVLAVSTYEEVGHGGAALLPPDVEELVVLDMAAVGEGQTSRETGVTLCVKDASGPYHPALGTHLRAVARAAGIELAVDVYPFYASDGSAAWRAGADLRVALVGPGVDASHAFERTHVRALSATFDLLAAYALSDGATPTDGG
jgi:putative aminopeptidase FrvX